MIIKPQPGPQERAMACPADILFYGGEAGGGKTYMLLMEASRFTHVPGFGGVIFRRTYPEIMNEGGLWDNSEQIYPLMNARPRSSACEWVWDKTQVSISFAHMQHEKDKHAWQGSQIPFIGFDEVTHFSRGQFFYMLSRNRLSRPCGIKPYIRCTCNPDPTSWVADFISWWIDQETGFPLPERDGKIRWMARKGENTLWFDSQEEAIASGFGPEACKSVSFIRSRLADNKILCDMDPSYKANLDALPLVDRIRLAEGNWKTLPGSGMFFRRAWFNFVDVAPIDGRTVRYWDRAATEVSKQSPDPDWTAGVKMRIDDEGRMYVLDVIHERGTPSFIQNTIKKTAELDGDECEQWIEVDPGQAGIVEKDLYAKLLIGYIVQFNPVRVNKVTRAKPASSQVEAGNVKIVCAAWNESFIRELELFSDWDQVAPENKPKPLPHDDQVDAFSGATSVLARGIPRVRTT